MWITWTCDYGFPSCIKSNEEVWVLKDHKSVVGKHLIMQVKGLQSTIDHDVRPNYWIRAINIRTMQLQQVGRSGLKRISFHSTWHISDIQLVM